MGNVRFSLDERNKENEIKLRTGQYTMPERPTKRQTKPTQKVEMALKSTSMVTKSVNVVETPKKPKRESYVKPDGTTVWLIK